MSWNNTEFMICLSSMVAVSLLAIGVYLCAPQDRKKRLLTHLYTHWFTVRISFFCSLSSRLLSERSRLSLGSVLGGRPDDYLLFHGPAVVRGCHRHLHRPHWLPENGDSDVGPRGGAQIPGSQVRERSCWTPCWRHLRIEWLLTWWSQSKGFCSLLCFPRVLSAFDSAR